jgi:hypothetical protein
MLLAPLLLSIWFSLCPQYGNPQCPTSANTSAALAAFRDANPSLMSVFLTVNTIIPYIYPVSYLGLGVFVSRRSPLFAAIGVILGWFGSIAWGPIAAAEFVYYDASRLLKSTDASKLLNAIYVHWQIYYIVAAGWVIGHLFAYVFLGLALQRSKIVPSWASYLMIFTPVLMGPIAYGTNNGWLQVAGYILILFASIPAAIGIVRQSKVSPVSLAKKQD